MSTRKAGSSVTNAISALLGILALAGCTTTSEDRLPLATLLIEDVTAIDAANGMRGAVDVVVVNKKIAAVGPDAGDDYRITQASIIDGTGKFVIPGLWDAHVHLTYDPQIGHEVFFPLSLAHGITSLRDTGGHLDQLAPARGAANQADTPDLFLAGPLLDGELRVYDGSNAFFVDMSVGLATPAEGRAMVDSLADAGVHFVKAYEMLAPDTFLAIVDQAKKRGLPVSAHIPLSMTVDEAIDAGVNDLQHLRNIELGCVEDVEVLAGQRRATLEGGAEAAGVSSAGALRGLIHSQQRQAALIAQDRSTCVTLIASLAKNGVFQTPTAYLNAGPVTQWFYTDAWRETFAMLPPELRARALDLTDRQIDEPSAEAIRFLEWNRAMLVRMEKAGVPLMAGTDAPIRFMTPGISLHAELEQMVANGVSPMRALEAATLGPARFFGIEGERGTIAPGMKADLVLLSANPLEDIRNTQSIEAVVKDGVLHDRAALDAMVGEVAGG